MGDAARRVDGNRNGKRDLHDRIEFWNDDARGIDRGGGPDGEDHAAGQCCDSSTTGTAGQLQRHGHAEGCLGAGDGHQRQLDLRDRGGGV